MKVTHHETVEEDRLIPSRTQGYMEENHGEMMEVDKEMTLRRIPLNVMVIVIVNMWRS